MKFIKTYEKLRRDTLSLNNDFQEMLKIIEENCKDYNGLLNIDIDLMSGKEIWTDSKCILVSVKYLDENYKP